MTTIQLKTEIQKVLEDVPESVLSDILDYLKQIKGLSPDGYKMQNNLKKILSEDKELFQRLAQ